MDEEMERADTGLGGEEGEEVQEEGGGEKEK